MQQSADLTWQIPLVASVIGGVVAGGLTLIGVLVAHRLALAFQKKKETQIIHGFLQALLDEIETVWQRYQDTMGATVETLDDAQPLLNYYPVYNDYFTIYHGNSFVISQIIDDELRKNIVTTYTKSKGLVDSFRFNNSILEKYENTRMTYMLTGHENYKKKADSELLVLVKYANTIKQSHIDLKGNIQDLLRALRKALK